MLLNSSQIMSAGLAISLDEFEKFLVVSNAPSIQERERINGPNLPLASWLSWRRNPTMALQIGIKDAFDRFAVKRVQGTSPLCELGPVEIIRQSLLHVVFRLD